MKPARFPQYMLLFAAGLRAARNRFFLSLPDRIGRTWLRVALFAGIPPWFVLMATGGALEGRLDLFFGGPHWQAAGTEFFISEKTVKTQVSNIPVLAGLVGPFDANAPLAKEAATRVGRWKPDQADRGGPVEPELADDRYLQIAPAQKAGPVHQHAAVPAEPTCRFADCADAA